MLDNRFTERAQTALNLAEEGAMDLGHNYIGTEHILLGLTQEGEGVAARALSEVGVTPEKLLIKSRRLSESASRPTFRPRV